MFLLFSGIGDYLGLAFFLLVIIGFVIAGFYMVRRNHQQAASLGLDENGDPVVGNENAAAQYVATEGEDFVRLDPAGSLAEDELIAQVEPLGSIQPTQGQAMPELESR